MSNEQHEQLASAARDVQALLTATVGNLDDVADNIVETHLDGEDSGVALVTLLTIEATNYLRLYAHERGVSVDEVLAERGQQLAQL